MEEKKKNIPKRRFKEFQNADAWEQREWNNAIKISTEMVNPQEKMFKNLPHVAPGNLESFTGRILNNVKSVKEENLISGKFIFRPGDIIYGKINPQLAKYALVNFEGLTSADAYVLKNLSGFHQLFIFYQLQTKNFYDYSVSVSKRSGMPKVNRSELADYKFNSPKIDEQKLIGEILFKIDQTITLHQRKLDKYKAIKESYLQEMFPAEGQRKPKRRFPGFTEDWEQRELGYGSTKIGDGLHGTPKYNEKGNVFFINGNNLINGKVHINKETKRIDETQRLNDKLLLNNNTILMSINGTIGNLARYNNEKIMLGKSVAYITVSIFDKNFIYYYLQNTRIRSYFINNLTGSTIKNLSLKTIRETSVTFPNNAEQKTLGRFFEKIDQTITLHQKKLDKLKKLKEALLEEMFV
ncbi:restriction endonuclease subunit S [Macrococcus sp. 18KM445]|uniref:restriction endonuclease subunit S n=1 Tax=Macrococcus equi TaxID=3395462 RepID=UPI0039BEA840